MFFTPLRPRGRPLRSKCSIFLKLLFLVIVLHWQIGLAESTLDECLEQAFSHIELGNGGYLFSRQALRVEVPYADELVAEFADFSNRLQALGITLVILPIPTKGQVLTDYIDDNQPLQGQFDGTLARANYNNFVSALQARNVEVVNVLSTYLEEPDRNLLFFKYDGHWTPYGAKRAAQATADVLEKHGVLSSMQETAFYTELDRITLAGASIGESIENTCDVDFPDEKLEIFVTHPVNQTTNLFSESLPEIVMVGTSHFLPHYNFEGFLKEAMRRDVMNVHIPGGALMGSIDDYLRSVAYFEQKPKVIIWEFMFIMIQYDIVSISQQFRQLNASIYGDCVSPDLLFHAKTVLSPELQLTVSPSHVSEKTYLMMVFDDLSIYDFDLTLDYGTSQERLSIRRSTRGFNHGKFYLSLPEGSILKHVTFHGLDKGHITLNLCEY